MAFLSWFAMIVGILLMIMGYMIVFKKSLVIYEGSYPEGVLSLESQEAIGSDLILLGIISLFTGLTELLIPEFKGRLFYFLVISVLVIDYMIFKEGPKAE